MMRWKKRGLIFDPAEHNLPHGCISHAQSPQALVFEHFIRVYFSTRAQEPSGKVTSHIVYVDYDHDFQQVRDISSHTVIPLGGLGCFDEHGIFPLHVTRIDNQIFGYISGINRKQSVPYDTAIGLAMSQDNGRTFERIGPGPIMASTLNEPCMIGDPFVFKTDGVFHMFYLFCNRWIPHAEANGAPSRVYKIAHAVSEDGVKWKRDGQPILEDVLGADECQALPTIGFIDGRYHMFFCFRDAVDFRKNPERAYRIGHATSKDLKCWQRDDESGGLTRSSAGWDSEMMCYPNIFSVNGTWHILYNGNDFGRGGFGLATLEK